MVVVNGFSASSPMRTVRSIHGHRLHSNGAHSLGITGINQSQLIPSSLSKPCAHPHRRHYHPISITKLQSARIMSAMVTTTATTLRSFHSNPSYVLTAILWLSSFGTSLERRTLVGKALSAPLATMALALTVANIGLIPFESPVYAMVNRYLVPLAVPLLLFDSDLKRVLSDTGTLLAAFGVGAFATIVGTIVAFPLVPLRSLGNDGWKVACALAARHIGGAINFVAVAETLDVGGNAVAAASKFISCMFACVSNRVDFI